MRHIYEWSICMCVYIYIYIYMYLYIHENNFIVELVFFILRFIIVFLTSYKKIIK